MSRRKNPSTSKRLPVPHFPTTLEPGHQFGALFVVALVFIAIELLYARLAALDAHHDLGETAASVGVALGDLTVRLVTSGAAAVPFFVAYDHRLLDIPLDRAWSIPALFIGVEFFYYWFHRASHRIRWLWATHAVHHSATRFNLSASIRLGWTGDISGAFVFFLPLAVLGFHPTAIAVMLAVGLLYQFFLHTALPVSLGPLEWVLNTPAHHRVHHASNDACLDKNYGSVLIVFDRLFGTFAAAPQDETLRFGLKDRTPTNNPLQIAFGEWRVLWRDVCAAPSLKARLGVLFGRP
jgi:sterol desaturase/sphingolipid hydroxylase (fatty acid hydroxylase superfamily)